MNSHRLIFFAGVYDTLDIFTYELRREFEQMGYETMLFDSSDMQTSIGKLAAFIKEPVTAAITFNNLGYNMELVPGKNIWDELGIFCINILMDHPFCYKGALDASPLRAAVLCTDRNHMRYIQRFYPGIPIAGYLPHAGIDRGIVSVPIRERRIDVLYAGGLSQSFVRNVMPDFSVYRDFNAENIAEIAYQNLIEHPEKTTEQAIEEALQAEGIFLAEEELCGVIADLHYVDLMVTSHYRELVIRTLVEQGISVHLYGYGWEDCEWIHHPNLFYGGRVAAEKIVERMQDAKIVLSTMTWFKDGTHDRVFNGMLAGAVAVTDSSLYMKEEFGEPDNRDEEEKLVMFELPEIAELPGKIRALLADEERMQRIAVNGYAYAREHHTWKHRAWELEQDLLREL